MSAKTSIIIETLADAPVARAWTLWTRPEHIVNWNAAVPEWHSPKAENDLRTGGAFCFRMEARDGSMGFDFGGTYTEVKPEARLAYALGDGRKVNVLFMPEGDKTRVREEFEPEGQTPLDMQQAGWQAILDNFAAYAGRNSQP